MVNGLADLGILPDGSPGDSNAATDIDIIHGSTIATNALLERKGAKVALVTTEGFIDVIDIGRQNRPLLYRLWGDALPPLVERDCRFGIAERIGPRGEVIAPIDASGFAGLLQELREKNVDSVAVCFLFSFLNPAHEQAVEAYLEDNGYFVSASYKVLPEYREYERLSTTVSNAFVTPLVANYLERLSSGIGKGLSKNLKIMQSNAGLVSASSAAKRAVELVLSGPAGGVVAAEQLGKCTGFTKLISFDMGGTSTDVCLTDGDAHFTTEFKLDGSPIKVPMVDIHTVGAGGGSIAWVDAGGALQVGPESAGSNPGPACYGIGEYPTITDANLVLGRLQPDNFLGGRKQLDSVRAERAISELADACGLDMISVASGVIKIAVSNMQKAVRKVSVERGYDPRDFTLVAFGGAGPMHACELAEAMLIPRVIIPQNPGVFSALGMTVSDVIKNYSKSVLVKQSDLTIKSLNNLFNPLISAAKADLISEGFSESEIRLEKMLDMRYVGQSFELIVPLADFTEDYSSTFHDAHKSRYGHASPEEAIEVVAVRVKGIGARRKPSESMVGKVADSTTTDTRVQVFFDGWHDTACYGRDSLQPMRTLSGPALIHQLDATIVIPPNWVAEVDEFGNLLLQKTGRPDA